MTTMRATSEFVDRRPMPRPDQVTRPYWDGTVEERLLFQECPACGHRQFYPRACCTNCLAVPEFVEASGTGTIHTFSVIRQNHVAPFRDWTPYVVAMIELDEGPRVMGNVVDVDVDDVRIGQRVEVTFVRANDDVALPFWRPAEG